MVRVKEEFRNIAEYLLGDTFLVPDLHSGIVLWQRNGFRGTLVTPDGDMISPHGVLTGGSRAVTEESSLLQRKREIADLEKDASRLEGGLREESQDRGALADRIASMEEDWESGRDAVREAELELQGRKKDVERYENELNWIRQRVGVIRFNRETLLAEEQEAAGKIAATERELETAGVRCLEVNGRLEQTQQRWQALKSDLEGREALLTEARVAQVALEEKRNADLKALERLRTPSARSSSRSRPGCRTSGRPSAAGRNSRRRSSRTAGRWRRCTPATGRSRGIWPPPARGRPGGRAR